MQSRGAREDNNRPKQEKEHKNLKSIYDTIPTFSNEYGNIVICSKRSKHKKFNKINTKQNIYTDCIHIQIDATHILNNTREIIRRLNKTESREKGTSEECDLK